MRDLQYGDRTTGAPVDWLAAPCTQKPTDRSGWRHCSHGAMCRDIDVNKTPSRHRARHAHDTTISIVLVRHSRYQDSQTIGPAWYGHVSTAW